MQCSYKCLLKYILNLLHVTQQAITMQVNMVTNKSKMLSVFVELFTDKCGCWDLISIDKGTKKPRQFTVFMEQFTAPWPY